MPHIRLALAQINPVLGDFSYNSQLILDYAKNAVNQGADIVVFPEMALNGYPIEDLATREGFLRSSRMALEQLAVSLDERGLAETPVIVGFADGPFAPRLAAGSNAPTAIAQNCAAVLQHGRVVAQYSKYHLPNYSVFDEFRNFISVDDLLVLRFKDVDLALIICEDLWQDAGPVSRVSAAGAGALLVINGSPFERDKDHVRLPLVRKRAKEHRIPVAYLNLVGGQDDLVFDGDSLIVDGEGNLLARAPQFIEHLLVHDLEVAQVHAAATPDNVTRVELSAPPARQKLQLLPSVAVYRAPHEEDYHEDLAEIWQALVLGLGDYVEKNGFPSVVLGLSGGIDSSVVAAIAADALGGDRVYGVSMPSKYSSDHSVSDADQLAENLGLHYRTEPIRNLVVPFEEQLALTGLAAENLQARARGVILMGLSNMEGHLVLTTGNKSELAVGYSTIYGDSVGGFNPIKDVLKTMVWDLAKWRNQHAIEQGAVPPIPANAITKPPSAELRPDQTDQDSLPDYDLLDAILESYITRRHSRDQLVSEQFDADIVDRVISLVDRAEWKRRQSAIGPKISGMAFGRDRRLPITYRHN